MDPLVYASWFPRMSNTHFPLRNTSGPDLRGERSVLIPTVFLFGAFLAYFRTMRSNRETWTLTVAIPLTAALVSYWIVYR